MKIIKHQAQIVTNILFYFSGQADQPALPLPLLERVQLAADGRGRGATVPHLHRVPEVCLRGGGPALQVYQVLRRGLCGKRDVLLPQKTGT